MGENRGKRVVIVRCDHPAEEAVEYHDHAAAEREGIHVGDGEEVSLPGLPPVPPGRR
jgi:hypothetical protein